MSCAVCVFSRFVKECSQVWTEVQDMNHKYAACEARNTTVFLAHAQLQTVHEREQLTETKRQVSENASMSLFSSK